MIDPCPWLAGVGVALHGLLGSQLQYWSRGNAVRSGLCSSAHNVSSDWKGEGALVYWPDLACPDCLGLCRQCGKQLPVEWVELQGLSTVYVVFPGKARISKKET